MSDWLILGTRNPYIQVQAPDFLKSHFGAKKGVSNYIIFGKSIKIIPIFVRSARNTFARALQNLSFWVPRDEKAWKSLLQNAHPVGAQFLRAAASPGQNDVRHIQYVLKMCLLNEQANTLNNERMCMSPLPERAPWRQDWSLIDFSAPEFNKHLLSPYTGPDRPCWLYTTAPGSQEDAAKCRKEALRIITWRWHNDAYILMYNFI